MRRRAGGCTKSHEKIYLTKAKPLNAESTGGGDTAVLPEREDAAEVSETKVSPTQVRNALAGLGDASTAQARS